MTVRLRPGTGRANVALIVVSVMLAVLIGPLNSTMIAVALPAITHDFGMRSSAGTWLVTVYLITMAALMPVVGKLGDRFGRRPVMLVGLVAFFVASAGAAIAPSFAVLMASRIAQAAAASVLMPNGIAILRETVSRQRLGTAIGMVGLAAPLAAAAGPPVGSLLLAASGWRALFVLNLAVLIVPLAVGWLLLPRHTRSGSGGKFDVVGSMLVCVLLVAFAGLLDLPASGWAVAGWALLLVVSGAVLLRQERNHPDPAVALGLFVNPPFAVASAGILLSNFAMYGPLLSLPLLLADRPHWPDGATGGVIAAMMVAVAVLAPFGGWLSDHVGQRIPAAIGFVVTAAGLAPLAFAGPQLSAVGVGVALAVAGVGMGLSNSALQTMSVEAVDPSETGMASGVYSTCRYLGSITVSALLAGPLASSVQNAAGFAAPFLTYTAAAAIGAVLIALLPLFSHFRKPVSCD
ncbi:MFS transporter [Spelaeicoccus albus]|uniref:EmrB/QacA subfamily drug resistance transporter n=1 Tax=Spelaeicoccus albus TaxID=1280376 RepID=A0A7Z0IJ39_9MICO|nr:MFS transporter [Spelaeicoccus albus]NYI69022.1 EmrB/QacA subfamily drug resistance transporter [Spelaeicoccus albus]